MALNSISSIYIATAVAILYAFWNAFFKNNLNNLYSWVSYVNADII